jgi:PAS domain S-box-containing protein
MSNQPNAMHTPTSGGTPGAPVPRPSEAQLAAILSIAAEAIVSVDSAQRITMFNRGAETIFGYRAEEVIGRPLDILIPERFRDVHDEHVRRFGTSGVTARRMGERMEVVGVRSSGEEFPAEASISRLPGPDGPIYTVVLRDATAQRNIEAALRQRERQLAQAQELARLGSWEWDSAADRVTWSDALYRIYGMEPDGEPVTFARFLAVVHPEDRARVERAVHEALDAEAPFDLEHRIVRPDGRVRAIHARGDVLSDPAGRAVGMIGTAQDVTERKEAEQQGRELLLEQAARASAEAAAGRLQFLARASETLASSLDYETTLRHVAESTVPELTDWCAVDLLDRAGELHRVAVVHADPEKVALAYRLHERYPSRPDAPHGVWNVIRSGEPEYLEDISDEVLAGAAHDDEHLRILRELGLRSALVVPLVARRETLGALTLVQAESGRRFDEHDRRLVRELASRAATAIDNARLLRDLREQRDRVEEQATELEIQSEELQNQAAQMEMTMADLEMANTALQERTREAEEANRAKAEFLSAMSHELRTPLNAIGGYVDLIEMGIHGPVTEAQREGLTRIRKNHTHLLGLINDILNFAKLEAGRVEYRMEDVAVADVLAGIEPLIAPQVQAKELTYTCHAADPGMRLWADAEKLQQILLNLVGNAVKFTPAGGNVSVRAEVDGPCVRIHVHDDGPGIPPDKAEAVFDPFVQVDRHGLGDSQQGVGLGLAISRDLARGMGGELTLEAGLEGGSTFTFSLLSGRREPRPTPEEG